MNNINGGPEHYEQPGDYEIVDPEDCVICQLENDFDSHRYDYLKLIPEGGNLNQIFVPRHHKALIGMLYSIDTRLRILFGSDPEPQE